MIEVSEKQFIRTFILELILVQKDSVFDLWDEERIELPNNYLDVLDEIISDDVKKTRYSSLIPTENVDSWKRKIQTEFEDFLNSEGVSLTQNESVTVLDLNRVAISNILFDKSIKINEKAKIACLAEDFLTIKTKAKPKVKRV